MAEQPAHRFRRDADAGVVHHETDALEPVRSVQVDDLEGNDAFFGELDRVADQIEQDLAQAAGISAHQLVQGRRHEGDDLDALGKGARGQQFDHRFGLVQDRELGLLQFQAPGLDLGEVQDVVDDGEQRFAALADGFGVIALVGGKPGIEEQPGHADDAVHGRADLVAHRGQEFRLGMVGGFRLLLRVEQFARDPAAVRYVHVDADRAAVEGTALRALDLHAVGHVMEKRRAIGAEMRFDPVCQPFGRVGVVEIVVALDQRVEGLIEGEAGLKQIGDRREHVPVRLIAQDQPVLGIEQHQTFGNAGDRGSQLGLREVHALLGRDRGGQVGRGAAIAGEDPPVGEQRRAADADGPRHAFDVVEAAGQSAEGPVRVEVAEPLRLGIGTDQFAEGPADGKLGGRTEHRFEIAEEAGEPQPVVHLPEPVGRGGGKIAEALLAGADLPLRLLPQRDVADHADELTPFFQRDLGDRQFDRKDLAGATAGDDFALAADDPGGAGALIAPHVAVMRSLRRREPSGSKGSAPATHARHSRTSLRWRGLRLR